MELDFLKNKMGDYGFPGAAECGGQDGNFHCLPDYDSSKCPGRERGLGGDDFMDSTVWCKYSGSPDADGRGWGYNPCLFFGDDYRKCDRFVPEVRLSAQVIERQRRILADLS